MSEVQEKDNFWLIIGVVVVCAIGTIFVVKSGEHGKYVAAEKAISEDSSNSAYRADVLHKDGLKK